MSDHFPREHGEPPHYRGPDPTGDEDEMWLFAITMGLALATVIAFVVVINIVTQPDPLPQSTPVPTADYSTDATATP